MKTLENRTAQLMSITEEQRENGATGNPVLDAEAYPNRFSLLTFFFSDSDGVKIQQDLDLNELTVIYFNESGEQELTEGALFDWALDLYLND